MIRKNSFFEHMRTHNDDFHFKPIPTEDFKPTNETPGTEARIEVYRERVERGEPLHHEKDFKFARANRPWSIDLAEEFPQ